MKRTALICCVVTVVMVGGCVSLGGGSRTSAGTPPPSTTVEQQPNATGLPYNNFSTNNNTLYVNKTVAHIGGLSCGSLAFNGVVDTVEYRLGDGVWAGKKTNDGEMRIAIVRMTKKNREGTVIDTPKYSRQLLESITPEKVVVNIITDISTISCKGTVTVENQTFQYD